MTAAHARIAAYYDAFNRRDSPAMLALLTDDVVHDVNQGPREHGRDAFAAFLARMDAAYRETVVDLVVLAGDDRAAAEFVVEGEYLRSEPGLPPARGQRYRLPVGAFFALRPAGHELRIARVTTYYNLPDWLAQVGA